MSKLDNAIAACRAHASSFLSWWGGELTSLMPERVKQRMSGDGKRIVLGVGADGFRVRSEGARRDADAMASEVTAPRAQAIAAAVGLMQRERAAGITLVLPKAFCFSRTVDVPRAALRDCRLVLDLDLERATPFRRTDVYTSYKVLNENGGDGKASVLQLVTKREAVDPIVADVVKAGGRVSAIDVAGPDQKPAGINFIAEAEGSGRPGGVLSAMGGLSMAAAVLLLLACGQVYYQRDAALEELRAQTLQLRKDATAIRQSLEQSEVAIKDLSALQAIKLKQVPVTSVLEEITRILPDTAWVTDLRIENDVVDISGLAKSGANLLPLFERSTIFGEAALTAPLTFDQREDKERFSLRVRIKSAEARSTGIAG